jgi:hypothetical protein
MLTLSPEVPAVFGTKSTAMLTPMNFERISQFLDHILLSFEEAF